jgi:hypothetical protein
MNCSFHHDWNPRIVSPSVLVPTVPYPMSEDQMALSGYPAASVQKLRVPSGGSVVSLGIGI